MIALYIIAFIAIVAAIGAILLWWRMQLHYPIRTTLRAALGILVALVGSTWISTTSYEMTAAVDLDWIKVSPFKISSGDSVEAFIVAVLALLVIVVTCVLSVKKEAYP